MSGGERFSDEVDGVPVFWPAGGADDRGYLMVRTGLVDEPFAAAGRTHAVEHLALDPLHQAPHDYNGSVGLITTVFVVKGDVQEQADFLGAVSRSLGQLPTARWSDERRVLEVEARGRGRDTDGVLLARRFGPLGYGAAGGHEWGLPAATGDDLAEWARDRFTRQQAAVYLSGPPPAGFRLSLPEGPGHPLPVPAPVLAPGRSVLVDEGESGPALGLLLHGHDLDVAMLCEALRHRLALLLRHASAVSYGPGVRAQPLGGDTFALTVTADCHPEDARRVTIGLLETVHALAEGGLTEPEVARAQRRLRWLTEDRDGPLRPAHRAVRRALMPGAADDHDTADPGRAAALLTPALGDALLSVPVADAVPEGWTVLPDGSPGPPAGPELYGQDDPSIPRRLVITGDGIGLHLGPDLYATVRWQDAVGVAGWDDGARLVLGSDTTAVFVDPAHWPDGSAAVALVDELAPDGTAAAQGHREPDEDDLRRRRQLADKRRTAERPEARKRPTGPPVAAILLVPAVLLLGVGAVVLGRILGGVGGMSAPLLFLLVMVWAWRRADRRRHQGD